MEDCIDCLKTDKKYGKKKKKKGTDTKCLFRHKISLSEQKLEYTTGSNGLHTISKIKIFFLSYSMNINKRQGDFQVK